MNMNSMKLMDLISPRCIKVPLQSHNKDEVLSELVDLLVSVKQLPHRNSIYEALIEREEVGSTGIGHGVALPHAKCVEVKDIYVACGISPGGIDFDALDRNPVHIFFLILAPRTAPGQHLKVMANLTRMLSNETAREKLLEADDADGVYQVLSDLSES
ncbi:PTS sugar transporter subunit IIA [bacterium]|nr:PTS sugar transporter subunit IIA [bacterium]